MLIPEPALHSQLCPWTGQDNASVFEWTYQRETRRLRYLRGQRALLVIRSRRCLKEKGASKAEGWKMLIGTIRQKARRCKVSLGGRLMQLESVPALAAETCLQLCIMAGPF